MITPDSKVGTILDEFPQLEAVIAELSPSFGALKTSALRQTVARATTLTQLAQADSLSIGIVVSRLRKAAGQEQSAVATSDQAQPDWATTDSAARALDARQIIEQGGHPLDRVMQGVAELGPGEVYELITPFVPTPLINLVRQQGFESHTMTAAADEYRTYFRRL
ncbi:MAG: DUF2249 domain-containing protein [Planctomycetota bacterium]|jgi:uncharacterized protein (DUF2249 family)